MFPCTRVVRQPPPLDQRLCAHARVGARVGSAAARVASPTADGAVTHKPVAAPRPVAPGLARVRRRDALIARVRMRTRAGVQCKRRALPPSARARVRHTARAAARTAVGAPAAAAAAAARPGARATSPAAPTAVRVHGDDALGPDPVRVHQHQRPAAVLKQVLAERGGRELVQGILLDPRAVHVRLFLPLDEVLEPAGD